MFENTITDFQESFDALVQVLVKNFPWLHNPTNVFLCIIAILLVFILAGVSDLLYKQSKQSSKKEEDKK